MTEHARLSASASSRWINCPGSLSLEEKLPKERKSSKFADEGTAAHWVGEQSLRTNKRCWEFAYRLAPNGVEITHDMTSDVQKYVDLVEDYAKGNQLFIEQRVDYSDTLGIPNSFGTSDAIVVDKSGEEIIVIDLKFGRGVEVSAEENEQLMLYALGAIETLDLYTDLSKLQRVRLVICQPRLGGVSEWDCSLEHLRKFGELAKVAARQAIDAADKCEPLVLNPGVGQCRWCRASATCPALAKSIEKETGLDFENLDATTETEVTVKVAELDVADLSRKMGVIELIEDWCTAIRNKVEEVLLSGKEVPGYKVVEGKRGNRKWENEDTVATLLKGMKLKEHDIYSKSLLSPTAIEKLLKDKPEKWTRLEELVTRSDGKPTVAPESDKRPPMVLTPTSDDFDALDGVNNVEDLL